MQTRLNNGRHRARSVRRSVSSAGGHIIGRDAAGQRYKPFRTPRNILRLLASLASFIGIVASVHAQTPCGRSAVIDAYDGRAVAGDKTGALSLFDVTQPESPRTLSTIQLAGVIDSVALAGTRILAGGRDRLYILKIAAPQSIIIDNVIELPGEVCSVVAAGDYGYAAVDSSVVLFDIPTGTVLDQRSYVNQRVEDLALAGDHMFILSEPQRSTDGGTIRKIAVQNTLADSSASLDLSPNSEQQGQPRSFLFADGQFLYVTSGLSRS